VNSVVWGAMNKLSINDVDLNGKKVFIRVDFNVPLHHGEVADVSRIKAALPTIHRAINSGAKIIVASHLGSPNGEIKEELSLSQVVGTFSSLLGKSVDFCEDCVGEKANLAVAKLNEGDVLLLENLRFHKEETDNNKEFSKKLGSLCDIYINDAFGVAHRAHASTVGIAAFVEQSACGYLIKREIECYSKFVNNPKRPMVAILGGAKVSTKIGVINSLIDKCETILIGGVMTFTFLRYMGFDTGQNRVENSMVEKAGNLMKKARDKGVALHVPIDFIVADEITDYAKTNVVTRNELGSGKISPDIGPDTITLYITALKEAKTVIWNGPMGVFEKKPFANGTNSLVNFLANSNALTVIGGGDSVTAVNKLGASDKMNYMSTGGGAFLKLTEDVELPGIAALTDSKTTRAI